MFYMSCWLKQYPDKMFYEKSVAKKAPFFWFQFGDLNITDIF